MKFNVSRFENKLDTKPLQKSLSLEDLRIALSKWRVRDEKDGPLWSPASYDLVAHRKDENVTSLSCLVLDFDGGHDWSDFEESWEQFTYCVHTSFSHTAEHPKWRAVFPLSEPVSADDWPAVYASLAIGLGLGLVDPACKDRSRMYYLPSHPEGAECYFNWHYGELLKTSDFPPVEIEEIGAKAPVAAPLPDGPLSPGDDYDLKTTWEEILQPHGWVIVGRYFGGNMTLWRRPGKRTGVSARTGMGRIGDRFYCWSSSCHPIKPNEPYRKYALLAALEYGHDMKSCGKALADLGYGAKGKPAVSSRIVEDINEQRTVVEIRKEPEPEGDYFDPVEKRYRAFSSGDIGNAERFISWFGADIRYVAKRGWHIWDGDRWKADEEGSVAVKWMSQRLAHRAMEAAVAECDESKRKELWSVAGKLMQRKNLESMLGLAHAYPQIEAQLDDFDKDPYLLGVANGTLDLRTGELRPPSPDDMITMRAGCRFEGDADCPRFMEFFNWALMGKEELMRFVLMSLGFSLTASDRTHAFWFLTGQGDNGKSVMMQVLFRLLGSYAGALSPESIMVRKNEQIPADIASIHGKRFVIVEEVESNKELNAGLMKALSAYAPIQARFLNKNFFTFRPKAKIWLTGNERPKIRNFDHGMRRRMKVIPFENQITEDAKDEFLGEKLWQEAPGILWLMMQGFQEYNKAGLPMVSEVARATDEYQQSEDYVGMFLEDECEYCDSSIRLAKKHMREKYIAWCKTNDVRAIGRNEFYLKIEAHGVKTSSTVTHGQVCFEGIRFKGELDV